MIEKIWILVAPDNGHWDESFAVDTILNAAEEAGVEAIIGSQTRDTGFGQERLIVVKGNEENVDFFERLINERLY